MARRFLLSLALSLIALPAAAQDPVGTRRHDGLHLSIGGGVGYAMVSASLDPEPSPAPDISLRGIGFAGQLLIGGTPAPGLVIGGGFGGGHYPSPTLEANGNETDADGDLVVNLLGPYVQYYFSPNAGLYAQAMLGFATMDDGDDDSDSLATGFGASAGLGNEWWIADEWSIGVLLRLQYLSTGTELDAAGSTLDVSYSAIIPAALVNVTYH